MKRAYIVVDLGFGDAGKGATVDWLAATTGARLVVRFNGGPQAGHNVVTPDGRHHTFSQFGAATFIEGTQTLLPAPVRVHPLAMLVEEAHLRTQGVTDAFDRMIVAREAAVVTPFHQATQRLRELARGGARHGSCGTGFGESMVQELEAPDDVIQIADLEDLPALRRKLQRGRDFAQAQLAALRPALAAIDGAARELAVLDGPDTLDGCVDAFSDWLDRVQLVDVLGVTAHLRSQDVIFEGAQGVLLDEWHGFHPYTTWSTTTFKNALDWLDRAEFEGEVVRLGLLRAYGTRHGPGPFPTEVEGLVASMPDPHNGHNPWQLDFRVGWLDMVSTRYALAAAGGADALVVSHLDRVAALDAWQVASAWALPSPAEPGLAAPDASPRTLLPGVPGDLDRQARLTALAEQARPVYRTIEAAPHAAPLQRAAPLLDAISAELDLPIALTAAGPTRAHRHLLSSSVLKL